MTWSFIQVIPGPVKTEENVLKGVRRQTLTTTKPYSQLSLKMVFIIIRQHKITGNENAWVAAYSATVNTKAKVIFHTKCKALCSESHP